MYVGMVPYFREARGVFYGDGELSKEPPQRVLQNLVDVGTLVGETAQGDVSPSELRKGLEGLNMIGGVWVGYPADFLNKTAEAAAAMFSGNGGRGAPYQFEARR